MSLIPRDLERLATEVDGWLELGCPDKALQRLQPLLDRPEARPEGLALRVRAYVSTKQHHDAIADLDELRRADYDAEWLDLTEAWCRKRIDDLDGSIRCMRQLLDRNSRSAIGHFNLGCYLALAGDSESGLDEVTIACGIDPTFRDLLLGEPDLHALHRDPRLLQLAEQHDPSDDD